MGNELNKDEIIDHTLYLGGNFHISNFDNYKIGMGMDKNSISYDQLL